MEEKGESDVREPSGSERRREGRTRHEKVREKTKKKRGDEKEEYKTQDSKRGA